LNVKALEIEAVYEHGTLRLSRELPLPEGQKLTLTIHPPGSAVERLYGLVRWAGDPAELHRFLEDPDEGQWGHHDI
jgi:predicted DNA-binding antitoxin AbrB/MazE fold protein